MAAISVLAFIYITLTGLVGVPEFRQATSDFGNIQANQTVMRNVNGKRAWVTRFGNQLIEKRDLTSKWVKEERGGCDINKAICLFDAATTRQGIEILYIEQKPPQVSNEIPWYGGYVNPLDSSVYDRFGRGYKINDEASAVQLMIVDH